MKWPTALSELFGLKSLASEVTARLFPEPPTQIVGETFADATISVGPLSKFKLCQFRQCTLVWEAGVLDAEADGAKPKLFLGCNFDDCDHGMPVQEFIAYAYDSTVNQQHLPRVTHEQALEEAVRRVHQRQPALTEQCLDPSSQTEREHLAQCVSAEYRKILMDA
jgi:hypothetical protein